MIKPYVLHVSTECLWDIDEQLNPRKTNYVGWDYYDKTSIFVDHLKLKNESLIDTIDFTVDLDSLIVTINIHCDETGLSRMKLLYGQPKFEVDVGDLYYIGKRQLCMRLN